MQLFFYSRSRYERTPVVGGLKTSLVNRAAGDRPCFMFSTAAASKLARELRLSCLELRQGFVPRLPSLVTFASLGYPTKTPALPGSGDEVLRRGRYPNLRTGRDRWRGWRLLIFRELFLGVAVGSRG